MPTTRGWEAADTQDQNRCRRRLQCLFPSPESAEFTVSNSVSVARSFYTKRSCLQKVHSRWRKWKSLCLFCPQTRGGQCLCRMCLIRGEDYLWRWKPGRAASRGRTLRSQKEKKGHCLFFSLVLPTFSRVPGMERKKSDSLWKEQHEWSFQSQITDHFPDSQWLPAPVFSRRL